MPYLSRVIAEIISLPGYERQVASIMHENERVVMEFFIAAAADHPLIQDGGGFRKARWALPGAGKSGGLRVITTSWRTRDGCSWLRYTGRPGKRTCLRPK